MRKVLYTTTLCVIFLGGFLRQLQAVEAAQQQTSTIVTYTNSTTNYAIDYPSNWQKKEIPKLDLVVFAAPKNDNLQAHASMNVVSEKVGSGVTLDQFYSESLANLKSQLKEVTIESSGTANLNETTAKWVIYTHVMQNIKFRVLQYFIVNQDNIYLMTFSAVADDFDTYRKDFEKTASSFRIVNRSSGAK